jgi:antitoxin YefM
MVHLQERARSDRGTRRLEHRAAPDSCSKTLAACGCKDGSPVRNGLGGRRDVRRGKIEASFAQCFGYTVGMTAVPLGDARDRLSEYVSEVERTHQRVTITRHGHAAAVLISADDLAAIEETLEILGTPGAAEAINEGLADAAAGRFADNEALKSRYGIA